MTVVVYGAEAAAAAGFLLPFRKPKRIRTAFSPSQLLQLEDAFGKNHYVVGQERKDLAASLSLTETQVSTMCALYFSLRPHRPPVWLGLAV